MTIWLLVLIVTLASGGTSVEKIAIYTSKPNCETASQVFIEQFGNRVVPMCIPIEDRDDVVD